MGNQKNNKGVIALLITIIVVLLALVILMTTGTINLNSKTTNNGSQINGTDVTNNGENINNNINNSSQIVINDTIKKLFGYVHSLSPYCGERSSSDVIEEGYQIWQASEFSSKNELNKHLKTFMTDSIINKYSKDGLYTTDVYKEQNGKLYCLNSNKDCGSSYNEEKTYYKIINATDNSITAVGTIAFDSCGGTDYYTAPIELNKDSNDNWLVSSYFEIGTGVENIMTIKSKLLDDIIYYNKSNPNHKIAVIYLNETLTSESDISSLKNTIDAPYESSNGEKWIEVKVSYDKDGYINQIIL